MVSPPPYSDLEDLVALAFDSGLAILLAELERLWLAGGNRTNLRRAVCGCGGLGARLCGGDCKTRIR